MEEILKEAAKQAPALVLMVFVVWAFLKHLGSRDSMMKGVFDEHVDERRESRKVIEENTKALRDNAETRGQVTAALHALREKL